MRPLDASVRSHLDWNLQKIEGILHADAVAIISPILPGLDRRLRDAVEATRERKTSISVILDTPGGIVEVVERMVATLRSNYDDMTVIVPDRAMSAGTIFALSADRIMMDYFSCLGPIDPQIEKDDKLVPALSYLNQFERLNQKADDGNLTAAEYALLSKLDLGELYQFEQARELSIELLVKWLSRYKFKRWNQTETRGINSTLSFTPRGTSRMTSKQTTTLPDRKEVLRRNPKIDVSVVAAHERLERDLKKLGVEIEPSYNIEPPFGRRPTRLHNHSRAPTRNS